VELQQEDSYEVLCEPCSRRGRRSVLAELTNQPTQQFALNGALASLQDRVAADQRDEWKRKYGEFCAQPGGWWIRPLKRGETVYGIVHSPVHDSRKMLTRQAFVAMKEGRKRLPMDGEFAYPLMTRTFLVSLKCARCGHWPRVKAGRLLDAVEDARQTRQPAIYI
jgi:hypothetical protein